MSFHIFVMNAKLGEPSHDAAPKVQQPKRLAKHLNLSVPDSKLNIFQRAARACCRLHDDLLFDGVPLLKSCDPLDNGPQPS